MSSWISDAVGAAAIATAHRGVLTSLSASWPDQQRPHCLHGNCSALVDGFRVLVAVLPETGADVRSPVSRDPATSPMAPGAAARLDEVVTETEDDLRARAAAGDRDALDQIVEAAGERGDARELRRLADGGSRDALDLLVELATEREDLDELRRLADAGSTDAAEILAELTDEA